MAAIKAPYFPYAKLRTVADAFHTQHHPTLALPVPIESIIEYRFGMDIVPMPGLNRMVKDGWISRDLTTIYVDEHFHKTRENRYRFTLANELSHRLLHADIIRACEFETIEQWKVARDTIPPSELRWIEWQADTLAGLILVPSAKLEPVFTALANQAFSSGVDIHEMGADARKKAFDSVLAKDFVVSPGVVTIRLEYDGLVARRPRQ